jgi:hypothetical protein
MSMRHRYQLLWTHRMKILIWWKINVKSYTEITFQKQQVCNI